MARLYSIKGFYLAVATTVTLGLGLGRAMPVLAIAEANRSEEFRRTALIAQTSLKQDETSKQESASGMTWDALTETGFPSGEQTLGPVAAIPEQDDNDDGIGLFFVFLGMLAFFAGLIGVLTSSDDPSNNNNGSNPVQTPTPGEELPPIEAISLKYEDIAPKYAPKHKVKPGNEPQVVPTPAMVPGLLAMGFKALRDKKRSLKQA
jgi:hypothetical protein